MKGIILALALAGSTGYITYEALKSPCDNPIEYSIGTFDQNFGISESVFKSKILQSEAVWEGILGKNLFEYKPGAKFTVNLIYDERQRELDSKRRAEFGLTAIEKDFRNADAVFLAAQDRYESLLSAHKARVAAFEAASSRYEADIKAANSRGGAKPQEFAEFEKRRLALNAEAALINNGVKEINSYASNLNALLTVRNTVASKYNSLVKNYNSAYGGTLEFDQAEYVRSGGKSAINVYEFKNIQDLVRAMTHELGHSLGMNHVDTARSIMYYLGADQTSPTTEDIAELKRVCRL